MENLKLTQKKVRILKRRTINSHIKVPNKNIIKIIAKKAFRITELHIKSIKNDLLSPKGLTLGKLTKFFDIKFFLKPNKTITQKGILVRMGKGKGKIKSTGLFITPGQVCILLIPLTSNITNSNYITKILNKFISKYSFFSYITNLI